MLLFICGWDCINEEEEDDVVLDAALDDVNVEKFCKILKELRINTKTKFLIITHHKITMSSIDRVYGVTMAKKGISDLVSVDFDKVNLKEAV